MCSYADGKRHKGQLFAKLKAAGQPEQRKTWEYHHVVEGQHYADVDFAGRLPMLYNEELPCVLIARDEHAAYNRLLHIKETDQLYRDYGLPPGLQQRSADAAEVARTRSNHPQLRRRVERLLGLYRGAYAGDSVLTTIAENVLQEALHVLR